MGSPGFAINAPNCSTPTFMIGVGAASKYRGTNWYFPLATVVPSVFRLASVTVAFGLNGTSPRADSQADWAFDPIHHAEYASPRSFCLELDATHIGPVSTGTGVL